MIFIEIIVQAPTHFLMGVLIYKIVDICAPSIPIALLYLIVFILAFLSHFLVDTLAKLTYHVKDPQPQDKFWVTYHLFILIFTIVLLVILWKVYWIAILGSILIDIIDWVIYRGILKKEPLIHPIIEKLQFETFSWIPNLLEKKWTVINEVAIWIILLLFISIL